MFFFHCTALIWCRHFPCENVSTVMTDSSPYIKIISMEFHYKMCTELKSIEIKRRRRTNVNLLVKMSSIAIGFIPFVRVYECLLSVWMAFIVLCYLIPLLYEFVALSAFLLLCIPHFYDYAIILFGWWLRINSMHSLWLWFIVDTIVNQWHVILFDYLVSIM